MFQRLILGAIFRQKRKMLMIMITVALGTSLATALLNVMLGVSDKINQELKVYGANIKVSHKDALLLNDLYGLDSGAGIENKYLAEADVAKIKQIFWGFNIIDFAPYLNLNVSLNPSSFSYDNAKDRLHRENSSEVYQYGTDSAINADSATNTDSATNAAPISVKVIGTWFDKTLNLPTGESLETGMIKLKNWWQLSTVSEPQVNAPQTYQNTLIVQNLQPDEIIIGTILASAHQLHVGDSVVLAANNKSASGPVTYKIKAILNAGGDEDAAIFMDLNQAQKLSGLEGKISGIEVSALTTPDNELARRAAQDPSSLLPGEYDTWYCTAYVSSICYQIQEVVTDSLAKPIRQVAESEGTILNKTKLLMLLITIFCSIGSALGISNLVTATVIERSQEIGLQKAIGAGNLRIILILGAEISLIALVGAVIGFGLGLGFAQLIAYSVFGSSIDFAPLIIPINLSILVLVISLGSMPAIRYLLKLKPTEVLHGR